MATRLLKYKTKMEDIAQTLQALPWIPTGELEASTVVKAIPGLVARLDVEAKDNGGDISVEVWDSPDATLTDDVLICRVRVITTTLGAQNYWECPLEPGTECEKGIYVKLVAGDAYINLLYK